jgi:hypothetical protein
MSSAGSKTLELQKQKFALQLERFNLSKKMQQEPDPEPPPTEKHDPFDDDIDSGDIPDSDYVPTPAASPKTSTSVSKVIESSPTK